MQGSQCTRIWHQFARSTRSPCQIWRNVHQSNKRCTTMRRWKKYNSTSSLYFVWWNQQTRRRRGRKTTKDDNKRKIVRKTYEVANSRALLLLANRQTNDKQKGLVWCNHQHQPDSIRPQYERLALPLDVLCPTNQTEIVQSRPTIRECCRNLEQA